MDLEWIRVCSASDGCVEIAGQGERVFLRTTAVPDRWLDLDRNEWDDLLAAAKQGALDRV
jgi:hypothetical protein